MAIRVAVPKETVPGERRVALVPDVVARMAKQGYEVWVEKGAGEGAFYPDAAYEAAGAKLVEGKEALYPEADLVLKIQPPSEEEVDLMKEGAVVVGFMQPHRYPERVRRLVERKVNAFALELIPRITRAQAMDVLSSQASVAGYKAGVLAADLAPKFFPMLTYAAGTIRPALVFVIGAGVAGLQAIATAKRLGAIVEAFDVRRAAGEQVRSLGARFLELDIDAEAEGGYARELTPEEKEKEKQMVADAIARADVVITTAQVPGKPAPRIVTREMVERMKPGSVIVDLAAESGGNCELTQAGEKVVHRGVTIYGPVNLPSELPVHASEMYARNLYNFVSLLAKEGKELSPDWDDEILAKSVLVWDGEVKHEPTRALLLGGEA